MSAVQPKQDEWREQSTLFRDEERFLFEEWIAPRAMDDFRGKAVLECGCGDGQHTALVAPVAARVTAVDLNAISVARERCAGLSNIRFLEADIATLDLGEHYPPHLQ